MENGGDGTLPAGLVPLPELGEGVVGTRVAQSARWLLWAKVALWAVLTAVALRFTVDSITVPVGLLLGLVLAAACGFMAASSLALVRHGDRPALTVDAESVHCHLPLNRVSVRLQAITRVERVRRDLLIEARGGIQRRGRPSRARWVGISSTHIFEVAHKDLVNYLSGRAIASRAPRIS